MNDYIDETLKKLWIANQKYDNADYDDAAAYGRRRTHDVDHANNKGTDQSAHRASLMGAFVICSLESIIAKQLNLVHSKLQASIEQADFSKMWSEILKKREAEHIDPTHYPNRTVTIQANRRHYRATCT